MNKQGDVSFVPTREMFHFLLNNLFYSKIYDFKINLIAIIYYDIP